MLNAECFSCSIDVLYRGLGISKLQLFFIKNNPDPDSLEMLNPDPQHWFLGVLILTVLFFVQPSVERETSYYLDAGHWFLSLYNDDSDPRQVRDHPCAQKYMNHSVSLLLTHLLYVWCLKILALGTKEVVIFLWAQIVSNILFPFAQFMKQGRKSFLSI
jgi:hypothetical protein